MKRKQSMNRSILEAKRRARAGAEKMSGVAMRIHAGQVNGKFFFDSQLAKKAYFNYYKAFYKDSLLRQCSWKESAAAAARRASERFGLGIEQERRFLGIVKKTADSQEMAKAGEDNLKEKMTEGIKKLREKASVFASKNNLKEGFSGFFIDSFLEIYRKSYLEQ